MNYPTLSSSLSLLTSLSSVFHTLRLSLVPGVILSGALLPPISSVTTSTTLTVSAPAVAAGTAETLTASVSAAGAPLTAGTVLFCDATAAFCEGPSLLGSAQLTSAGSASVKLTLGLGTYSVKAVFVSYGNLTGSTSSNSQISVTGAAPTTTTLLSSGSTGNFTLTATVGYHGLAAAASAESISFLDTTSNYSLGSAGLSALSAPSYSFSTLPNSPVTTGVLPSHVVSADFNGDGVLDLAVSNFSDGTVSVFAGDGMGGFTPIASSPFAVGSGPGAMVAGDFNGDGLPDIAVANLNDGTVALLLGTSSGNFTLAGLTPVGSGPQSLVAADLNHDGQLDLAVANQLSSNVSVLLGDGTGQFTPATTPTFSTGSNPGAIVSGLFGTDTCTDLAVANATDNTVSVFAGDCTGGFTAKAGSPIAVPTYPVALAVGDFDGNGTPDLAVVSGTQNNVTILLGNATGFTPASGSPVAAGSGASAIAVADFDRDGKQDLLVTNSNDGTASVLLGDGTGNFTQLPQTPLANFAGPSSVAVGDFNGDGTTDLAVTNQARSSLSVRPLLVTQSASAVLSNVSPAGGGNHSITGVYAGDSLYAGSTSNAVSLAAELISTTTTLGISPSTSPAFQQALQLTATVAPASSSNLTAGGSATFYDGSTVLGTAPVAGGQAVLSVSTLGVGSHSLAASYAGDANFAVSSTAAPATVLVGKAVSTAALTLSANTTTPGTPVTLTAVIGSSNGSLPTGSVSFYDNTTLLGQGMLSGGQTSFSTSGLAPGLHSITAVYAGDPDFTGSTSAAAAEQVSDFTLTAANPTVSVIAGATATYRFSIAPMASGFTAPVTFSVSGLPPGSSATFSPATLTPGAGPVTTVLTVTTVSAMAKVQPTRRTNALPLTLAVLLFPLLTTRRLRRLLGPAGRGAFPILLALASLGVVTALTAGCSSSNPRIVQGTSSYSLTVTATGGSVSHVTTVTLNLQ